MAFPVSCPACGKAFQLATDIYERKVAGKIVSIKCKQCHAGIRVDATKPGELKVIGATPPGGGDLSVGPRPPEPAKSAETTNRREGTRPAAAASAPVAAASATKAAVGDGPTGGGAAAPAGTAPVRLPQPTLIGMVGPSPTADKADVDAKSSTPLLWAVDSGGAGDDRELSEDEIRREIQNGTIGAQTLVWREGMAEWLEIGKVPELKRFFARPQPKAPARSLERPAPRVQPAPQPPPSIEEDPDAERTVIYDRSSPNAVLEPFAAPRERDTTARVMLDDTAKLAEEQAEPALPPPPPPVPADRPFAFGKSSPAANPPQRLPPTPQQAPLGRTMPLGSAKAPPFAGGKTTPLAEARPTPFREAPPPPPPPMAARPAPAGKTTPLGDAPPPPPLAARPAPAVPVVTPLATPVATPLATPVASPGVVAAPEPPAPPRAPQAPALAPVPWSDSPALPQPAVPAAAAPFAPDPFAVAATTDLDFPPARSKKPLVIAAVLGVLAVIGFAVAITLSKSPPVANIAAPPPAPKATATIEAKQPEEPAPTSEPARTDPLAPSEPAPSPQSPSGNFSELFSKGAESAKGGASAPGTKAFDEAGARAALAGLLKAAAACKEPGGPTGQASATVTFEPNGTVSGVTVGAPFAGSSTGTCIVTAFKGARVAPFSGLPGTVSQTISLR